MGSTAYTPPTKRELIRREILTAIIYNGNPESLEKLVDNIMNIVEPQKADVVATPTEEN